MKTEIKKKEQAMMCAEELKLNNVRNKKLNSKETRKTSGITLIALVVTIVVLLILAGITISLVFSENGIIAKAKEAAEKTNQAAINEQEQMNEVAGYLDNMLNEIGGSGEEPTPPKPTLPSDGSYSEEKGVNTPNLGEGMTAIKWNGNSWEETKGNDVDWYDYSTKKWANAKTSDGSMWVWIPRYAYSITSGYHQSGAQINPTTPAEGAGNIEVEFMKGLTNETSTGRTSFQNSSGQGNWNIHPAFNYGQTVSGIWVAKFEASPEGATTNTSNSEYNGTGKKLQVKPGVSSWRYITIGNMYTVCKNYNSTLNSHMMKNDEWGAVAYLSKSKYGKQNEEVWINNSGSYITGSAG
ncbi:MAG: type II secretion system protein, partial [Clostridia bacterium]|nr:type II secretion system protein [Clostridia bacterium]